MKTLRLFISSPGDVGRERDAISWVIQCASGRLRFRCQEQLNLLSIARDGGRFDLLPPTPDEISQIIRLPASLAALQFEPHPTTAEHTLADTDLPNRRAFAYHFMN